jgi:hypothetical protein
MTGPAPDYASTMGLMHLSRSLSSDIATLRLSQRYFSYSVQHSRIGQAFGKPFTQLMGQRYRLTVERVDERLLGQPVRYTANPCPDALFLYVQHGYWTPDTPPFSWSHFHGIANPSALLKVMANCETLFLHCARPKADLPWLPFRRRRFGALWHSSCSGVMLWHLRQRKTQPYITSPPSRHFQPLRIRRTHQA